MPMKQKGISLGQLQEQFETAKTAARAAERQLERAQDTRDKAQSAAAEAYTQLKNASRAVLG